MRWLAAAIVISARLAHADDAADLFAAGRTLVEAGDYAGACVKFTASYNLDRAVGTELNLADCHERLGHLRQAAELFEAAAVELDRAHDKRGQFAHARHDALAAKLGTIVVRVPPPAPAGLVIKIAGHEITGTQDRVDPGEVEVDVIGSGRPEDKKTVHVDPGATVVVDALPPPPSGKIAPPPLEVATERRRSRVYLAWGAGGLAAATAVVSIGFGLAARSDYDAELANHDCMRQSGRLVCNGPGTIATRHAGTLADVATGFGVAAVALGAAGAVLFFTAPRDTITVAPTASSSSLGVVIGGGF